MAHESQDHAARDSRRSARLGSSSIKSLAGISTNSSPEAAFYSIPTSVAGKAGLWPRLIEEEGGRGTVSVAHVHLVPVLGLML